MRNEEFLSLSLSDVLALVGRDDLYVPSEEVVFEAVVAWTRHNTDTHSRCQLDDDAAAADAAAADAANDFLPRLLSLVRLPLLSPAYLADVVAKEKFVRESLACRDLLDEAKGKNKISMQNNPPFFRCRYRLVG